MNQHGVKNPHYTFLKILTINLRIISFCTKIYSCPIYVVFPQCATEFKGSARIFPKSSAESVSSSISPMTALFREKKKKIRTTSFLTKTEMR